MTQVTGKIFQMWDKDGEAGGKRRYPKTVIEAVLGLPTYLQQQFSTLADIYMPIEGISEALTGQEFVYRISPNTIKAKSLTLDRILGRTLAWNQLVDFNNSGGDRNGITYVRNSDGSWTLNGTSTAGSWWFINSTFTQINGHKYYARSGGQNDQVVVGGYSSEGLSAGIYSYSRIITCTETNSQRVAIIVRSAGVALTNYKVTPLLVDLTLLYGSEIDGMTDAQILAKFESEFPGYHASSAGKLISNDAKAIETVGFNRWDEEWEQGYWDYLGKRNSNEFIRSKNYIPVVAGANYHYYGPTQNFEIDFWDANGNWISPRVYQVADFTAPSNAKYMTFYTQQTTYNHNICINLSDATRNGQYEPYWKRTLPLNLGSFKVKSPNIWDEEREGGAIDTTSGQNTTSNTIFRSKNYIEVLPNTEYCCSLDGGVTTMSLGIFYYDSSKNYISYTSSGISASSNKTFTIPSNCSYIRFTLYGASTTWGTTPPTFSICVNKSDPAFNGRYFSHEDITITGGVKGVPSAKDEIIGNKFIKRVNRVAMSDLTVGIDAASSYNSVGFIVPGIVQNSDSKATNHIIASSYAITDTTGIATVGGNSNYTDVVFYHGTANTDVDKQVAFKRNGVTSAASLIQLLYGVYLDYQLAYPETYELVEPLVPTMKAGTTEARISPNADGLSAPFRADITYSAQENNDSASSQYAAVAGRLLNPQTIWGQTFDGSSPVTGALTGVTTINGTAIQINSSGNVGIGTAATTAKLKVNGEIDCGGITCGGEAIFTDGIELDSTASYKIWYDDEYNRIIFTVPNGDYLYSTGGIVSASYITAGASSSSSDANLKDNIASVTTEHALSIFSALSGREWDWNDKMTAFEGQHCSGLVAQEVQKVMPWAVLDYNDTLSLNYNCLWGIAIPVIQNLMHRVEELESKLKTN